MIESRINKHSASMALLIPWLAIDPVADAPVGQGEPTSPSPTCSAPPRSGRAVAGVPVTLRAEVAAVELPIDEILALARAA